MRSLFMLVKAASSSYNVFFIQIYHLFVIQIQEMHYYCLREGNGDQRSGKVAETSQWRRRKKANREVRNSNLELPTFARQERKKESKACFPTLIMCV